MMIVCHVGGCCGLHLPSKLLRSQLTSALALLVQPWNNMPALILMCCRCTVRDARSQGMARRQYLSFMPTWLNPCTAVRGLTAAHACHMAAQLFEKLYPELYADAIKAPSSAPPEIMGGFHMQAYNAALHADPDVVRNLRDVASVFLRPGSA